MTDLQQSRYWYRVAQLKPRLRSHVEISRQRFRGQTWYVMQDHATGRFHRLTSAAYFVTGLLDGRRTLNEVWASASETLGEGTISQDELIRLLAQLHRSDALVVDVVPDVFELYRRQEKIQFQRKLQSWRSPLAVRFPLLDPERFLSRTLWLFRPLFTRWGALLWFGMIAAAGVQAALHWSELTTNLADRVLAADNLAVLLLTYPLLKTLHEFGHAYATRAFGGEVHEMGIMLLVLMPIPYVDASSSHAFANRWQRALVGAAGMITELFVASLALFFWVQAEPGLARAIAFNIMVIAGVSTLLFNGNPLIRFDGYYILSDIIEIPNLASRATRYIGYLFQRYLFTVKRAESPVSAPGEAPWFFVYAIASFVYRLFIIVFILTFLAGKFFFIGVLLAVWGFVIMVVTPVWKHLRFLFTSPRLNGRRPRAIAVAMAIVASLAALGMLPLPLATMVDGVVWVPPDSHVRVDTDGFVEALLVKEGQVLKRGDPIAALVNPDLRSRALIVAAERSELESRHALVSREDRVEADLVRKQIDRLDAQLERLNQRIEGLVITTPADGLFVRNSDMDLVGRFLPRGSSIGFMVYPESMIVRTIVDQSNIDLVRKRTRDVSLRLAHRIEEKLPGRIVREVPEGTEDLPSLVFASEGGGKISMDPRSSERPRALERLFQFDIAVDALIDRPLYGERVYVRFDHGSEAAARQLFRRTRQALLKRFDI